MKRRLLVMPIILMLLVGCVTMSNLQAKWNSLTQDQKARIVINDLQGQLTNLFDQGKLYVTANPTKQTEWKTKVIPAFDVANKALGDVIALGRTQLLTPDLIYARVQPRVNEVLTLLVKLGVMK